jgi:hypothetical protein
MLCFDVKHKAFNEFWQRFKNEKSIRKRQFVQTLEKLGGGGNFLFIFYFFVRGWFLENFWEPNIFFPDFLPKRSVDFRRSDRFQLYNKSNAHKTKNERN